MALQAGQRAGLLVNSETDQIARLEAGYVQEISRRIEAEGPRDRVDFGPARCGQSAGCRIDGERGDAVMPSVSNIKMGARRVNLDL